MKYIASILIVIGIVLSCKSPNTPVSKNKKEIAQTESDTVRIANDSIEYEIIIIEPGFNSWLVTTARPEGFYSQTFLELKNIQYVIAYNQRVLQSQQYDPNLYPMQIDYQQGIDYGYEVNYKLYNYFIYFQLKYKQQLTGMLPRI